MNVPFLDLSIKSSSTRELYHAAIEKVFCHGRFVLGPEVDEFEKNVAGYCKCDHVSMVSSGTDALFLALRALDIGKGDEVVVPAMTFVATANAVSLTGATPVLADVGNDFNMDPSSLVRVISKKTKAVIPVHYAGKIADMDSITTIARQYSLHIIEDASQAFGAKQKDLYAGTIGDVGCISLNSMKILSALGEAGIVLSNNKSLIDKIDVLRYNGLRNRSECVEISSNFKPDTLHAAVLIKKLEFVNGVIARRREIAAFYSHHLADYIDCPKEAEDSYDVYYTYTVKVDERDRLQAYLANRGIETKVYHPVISHEPVYENIHGERENAERLYAKKLALPCNENLTYEQIEYIKDEILKFYK